jgi:hypothetical protein
MEASSHVKDVANAIAHTLDAQQTVYLIFITKIIKLSNLLKEIKEKIREVTIETTPLPFKDARNYQVSSDKLKTEYWI